MCEPVSIGMASLAVLGAYQSQEAAMKRAEATNEAFERNQALQNEAYTKDMEAFWDEEIAIQQQAYQNAEDAADAKIDMLIESQEQKSSLTMANLASGASGASPSRGLNILRRQLANRSFDLDQQFQRGVASLKGERKALQRDKLQRRYSAMGQINSMERDPGLSQTDRILGLTSAGVGGYATGQSFAGPSAKAPSSKLGVGRGTGSRSNIIKRGYGGGKVRRGSGMG